jgi:hypothetical protein
VTAKCGDLPTRSIRKDETMILFKSCPRCTGDMQISGDNYGDYKQCLNCGMLKDISKPEFREVVRVATSTDQHLVRTAKVM